MTTMTLRQGLSRFLLPSVCLVVIILSCAGAFVGLDASSFWVDELFSAYFSDPAQPDLAAVFGRAVEDVNPPAYYLLLWAVLHHTGLDIVTGSRGLSAALGCLAIVALVLAPGRGVGLAPRLFAGAFAATSTIWFQNVQEARTYALIFLLAAGMTAAALRCLDGLRAGRAPVLPLAALAVLSLAASLSHYYAILLSGALFTMLLPWCRSWRALGGVVIAGLLVLVPFVAFLAWHQTRIVADVNDTWFSASAEFLSRHFHEGLKQLLGTTRSIFLLLVLGALALWALVARGPRDCLAALGRDGAGVALAVLAGSFVLACLYALAVTFAVTPMLSLRFFNVLAPVAWIALAYAAHVVIVLMDGPVRAPLSAIFLSLTVALAGTMALDRGRDMKEPWRHGARTVAEIAECRGATLPVVWWPQAYITENDPERFHGFYMPPDPERRWLTLDQDALPAEIGRDEMAALVRESAAGRRACPLLLWAVHMPVNDPDAVARALAAHLDPGSGDRVTVTEFSAEHGWQRGYLFRLERAGGGGA
jgi:hypothetical protein